MTYGDRIRQARELLGWTQEHLAEKLGVRQPVIAQLEAGLYQGRGLTATIAFRTGFPPAFFTDPYIEDFPLGSLQFRGHSRLMRRDRQQAHRYGQLVYELYRRVGVKYRRQELRLPRIVTGNYVQAATATRSAMGLPPDTPIKNLVNSAEKIGVVVLGLPVTLDGRNAFSVWAHETPIIAISAGMPGDRIRLTVAHELGHLVMHQAIHGTIKAVEKEAFAFGGELLLPTVAMHQEMVPPVTLSTLVPLKTKWKVSLQVLIMRARELRIISERQYYYLFEQMSRAGFRTAEPANLAVPIEKPRALRQMVEMRYGRPIDYRRLSADTKLPSALLEKIIDVHAAGNRKPTGGSVAPFRRPAG